MAKEYYMPRTEKERLVWLNNFSKNFETYAGILGFTDEEVLSVKKDAMVYSFLVHTVDDHTKAKEQRVNYKNLVSDGPIGTTRTKFPEAVASTLPPAEVEPGIFPRIAKLVYRIKASLAYTETIGKILGVIGSESVVNIDALQPVLKLVRKGGAIQVQWTKSGADSVYIEVDRGSGNWEFLAVDSVPHYTDKTPVAQHSVWKYRAIYLIKDERVGQWSDPASIAV